MFDLGALRQAVAEHGAVHRVVIAALRGSSPREVGAAMLVWDTGQSGTIGGGTLEFQAAGAARVRSGPGPVLSHHALGPDLGQCCGGAVTLLTETYDAGSVAQLNETLIARPVSAAPVAQPLAVARCIARARDRGAVPEPQLLEGWMIEPVQRPSRDIWIWGAGHVGRALVDVLAPLPEVAITWVDTGPERFPVTCPPGVTAVPAAQPGQLVRHALPGAEHLILTYSHELDLDLCHRLLRHHFGFAGLIGSATKWARFRSRLRSLGHAPDRITDITCPIGDPSLGKHPQMIAIGVAAALLRPAVARMIPNTKDMSA